MPNAARTEKGLKFQNRIQIVAGDQADGLFGQSVVDGKRLGAERGANFTHRAQGQNDVA
jgi:hypothetical protein